MACGTQRITGLSDDDLGLAVAAADLENARRLIKQQGADQRWTLTIVFDPCPGAVDQVAIGTSSPTVDAIGPTRFIAAHKDDAAEVKATFSVPIAVTLAQSALETGWGRAAPGNAFFGLKASPGQPSVSFMTHEVESGQAVFQPGRFRAYDSFRAAALDYGKLLRTAPRYAAAFMQSDPELFAQAIADAHFATDPDYGAKLRSIIRGHGLRDLDTAAAPGVPLIHPPAAAKSFAASAVAIATEQWHFFGKQDFDVRGHLATRGRDETEDGVFQRVGRYWSEGVNTPGLDGRDTSNPWSAAYISWVMRQAGAGKRFHYSARHSVFINQGIMDAAAALDAAGYWTVRLAAAQPSPGDLVCWTRQSGIDFDHQNGGDYDGHSDVVVGVGPGAVTVIGGNVGNSVSRRALPLDANGCVMPVDRDGERVIALMRCRLG